MLVPSSEFTRYWINDCGEEYYTMRVLVHRVMVILHDLLTSSIIVLGGNGLNN